jgi:hypothetical protein
MANPFASRAGVVALLIVAALALGVAIGWIVRGERSPPLGLVAELEQQVEALREELAGFEGDRTLTLAVPYAYDMMEVIASHLTELPNDMAARSCRGGLALQGDTVRRPQQLSLADCRYGVRAGEPYVRLTLADGRLYQLP